MLERDGVQTIEILSTDGKILMVEKPGLSGEINITKLSAGFYLARLVSKSGVEVLNFIKRKIAYLILISNACAVVFKETKRMFFCKIE